MGFPETNRRAVADEMEVDVGFRVRGRKGWASLWLLGREGVRLLEVDDP
jgi:hypothetical protein